MKMTDILSQRFGYGPADGAAEFASPEAMLQGLASVAAEPDAATQQLLAQRLTEQSGLRRAYRDKTLPQDQRKLGRRQFQRSMSNAYMTDAHRRVALAVAAPSAFFDRLVSFWSNHFTVSVRRQNIMPIAGLFEDMAIRPHVAGRFEDMLLAAEFNPAMMMYLDLVNSVGPNSPQGQKRSRGLNENLAREILELHTMGVNGGYSQRDVTEFAKIMTGWVVGQNDGLAQFKAFRAEPGRKVFLNQQLGGAKPAEGDFATALKLAASHPSTARHIARKLVRHFIAEKDDPAAEARVAEAFTAANGGLLETYRALLELPEAAGQALRKARTDFEFVVSALRAARVSAGEIKPSTQTKRFRPQDISVGSLNLMQQKLWSASSPAGWPERPDEWLGPAALAERLEFVARVVPRIRDVGPNAYLDRALNSLASDQTRQVIAIASSREEAIALIMASPEFNRR